MGVYILSVQIIQEVRKLISILYVNIGHWLILDLVDKRSGGCRLFSVDQLEATIDGRGASETTSET